MRSAHAAGFDLLSGCGTSAASRPVELQAPTAPQLATPRPFNAQHMPNIPDMFAERLKLQKRIMTLLEPIIHEQAAAEARNEAAMRQAYARAISRRCNDVPRYLLSQMPCSVRDRFCPFRLAAEKPAAMAAPRPPEENRSARYEWL